MIAIKPAGEPDPAMKSALKKYIMHKRQQLKQELEQDAIEKRLKREQEAKRKKDAMTLNQVKEQLVKLEKTLENLKNEKHTLFAQLKQNIRELKDDERKQKAQQNQYQQQQQQNQQQQQQQQQQHQHQQQQQQHQQQQQQHQHQQQQQQQLQQQQHQQQQQQQQQHQQQHPQPNQSPTNLINNCVASSTQPTALTTTSSTVNSDIPTPVALTMNHIHRSSPSAAPIRHTSPPAQPMQMQTQLPPPPMPLHAQLSHLANNQAAMNNHAGIQQHFQTQGPPPPSSQTSLPLSALPLRQPPSNNPTPIDFNSIQQTSQPLSMSQNHAFNNVANSYLNLSNEPPRKKLNSGLPPPLSTPPAQAHSLPPTSLSGHCLPYPGLRPNLSAASANNALLQANWVASNQNMMRTTPPANINSILSNPAFAHLLNPHYFANSPLFQAQPPPPPSSQPSMQHPVMSLRQPPTSNPGPVDFNSIPSSQPLSMPQSLAFNNVGNSSLNLSNEPLRKKLNSGLPPPLSTPPAQAHSLPPTSIPGHCLPYPGLRHNLSAATSANNAALMQANWMASIGQHSNQSMMRTPPPANINSLLTNPAFAHLLNPHYFATSSLFQAQPPPPSSQPSMQHPGLSLRQPPTSNPGPIDFNSIGTSSQPLSMPQTSQPSFSHPDMGLRPSLFDIRQSLMMNRRLCQRCRLGVHDICPFGP